VARDENGRGLSDIEIRSEVDTLLFAGEQTHYAFHAIIFLVLVVWPMASSTAVEINRWGFWV